jgi:hypothetical protein
VRGRGTAVIVCVGLGLAAVLLVIAFLLGL